MPDKLIPGKERTMAYKKGPFKLKGYAYPGEAPTKDVQHEMYDDPKSGRTYKREKAHTHKEEK